MTNALRANDALWERFTSAEEYAPVFTDQYGRFRFFSSRYANPLEPAVSRFLIAHGMEFSYPEDHPFAVCLTHDIDWVRYPRGKAAYEMAWSLARGEAGRAVKLVFGAFVRSRNPLWNFSEIMDMEERYGARSSFYFLALEPGERDFAFRVADLRDEVQEIRRRGWEVGLHGGHDAYRDADALRREKDRIEGVLGKPVEGYRSHYLRFDVPCTWRMLAEAGFLYDATFGYPDCPGFRNGMCHPYKPFDRSRGSFIEIVEIPLIAMDRTFDAYLRLADEKAWEIIRQLIDVTAQLRGVFTVLWHNSDFFGSRRELYERILSYCRDGNAWIAARRSPRGGRRNRAGKASASHEGVPDRRRLQAHARSHQEPGRKGHRRRRGSFHAAGAGVLLAPLCPARGLPVSSA